MPAPEQNFLVADFSIERIDVDVASAIGVAIRNSPICPRSTGMQPDCCGPGLDKHLLVVAES